MERLREYQEREKTPLVPLHPLISGAYISRPSTDAESDFDAFLLADDVTSRTEGGTGSMLTCLSLERMGSTGDLSVELETVPISASHR